MNKECSPDHRLLGVCKSNELYMYAFYKLGLKLIHACSLYCSLAET